MTKAKGKKARGRKAGFRQPALETSFIQTYQCRPQLDARATAFLDDCSRLFSRIEHSLKFQSIAAPSLV